jgi:hypothetical protein
VAVFFWDPENVPWQWAGGVLQVGDDEFGYMLADVLKDEKVETKGIRFDAQARTALAFVTLRADGEREFMFYRNPSADMLFEVNELDIDLIKKVLLSRTRLRNFRILWGLQISGMYSFLAWFQFGKVYGNWWFLMRIPGIHLSLWFYQLDYRAISFDTYGGNAHRQRGRRTIVLWSKSAGTAVAVEGGRKGGHNVDLGWSWHH